MSELKPSPCKGCGAPILWVKTKTGADLCLDVEPTIQGNTILKHGPGLEDLVAHVETKVERAARLTCPIEAGRTAFVPHWATCPKARDFKRSKTSSGGTRPAPS